jgi:tellurite methyltransferase
VDLSGWNERHRASAGHLEPEPLVVSSVRELAPGRALDLACGTGRNALWLAEHGWKVTAVDGSPVAIEMLRQRGENIDARIADLERGEYMIEPESWELILMCRYLQRDLFEPSKNGVVPGGVIIAVVRLEGQYRVNPGELAGYFEGFEILHSRESSMAEIVARRPARG